MAIHSQRFILPSFFFVAAADISTISCYVPFRYCTAFLLAFGTKTTPFGYSRAPNWVVDVIIAKLFISFAAVFRLDTGSYIP